jgi:type I restriction enzyme S subunit
LRFPEFEGEWKRSVLEKESIINPKTPPLQDEFIYIDLESVIKGKLINKKVVSKSEAPSRAQRVLSKQDILFQCVRPYQLNNYVHKETDNEQWVASTGYAQIRTMSNDTNFLYQLLNTPKFNQDVLLRCTGSSYPAISSSDLGKISISVCSLEEQRKIGCFLSLLDERIVTQSKMIEQYKSLIKGLSYLLFCEQKNKPFLRFPQYHKEWEKVKLKEMVSRITRRNKENRSERALTIAAQYGLVDQSSFFNKQVASVDLSNYYLLYHGEFAYNKSYSKDYPWGAVKRLNLYKKGALSTLYICFSPKDTVNSEFLVHYFETNKWYRGISEIAGEGARNHGLLNISIDDYFNTTHYLPSIEEQRKIASFFNLLCVKLDKEHNILQAFETQKRYILEHMFI